ncbi:MAG: class I SAM-dependent methyltransferase [Microthrixaceae bacterium]
MAAGSYAKSRPAYAREAIGMLKDQVATGPVLDLAAGTGILTGQMLRARREVCAVEPLQQMRDQFRLSLPGVPLAAGTAEAIPFRAGVFAGVVVAQAFHWFDARLALGEIARVLVDGGTMAILFNVRDESVGWVRELTDLMEARSGGRPYSDQRERSWESVVSDFGRFVLTASARFDNPVPSSPSAVLDRVGSTSFVAMMDDAARESLMAEVSELIASAPETAGRSRFEYPHTTELRCWALEN